jgi:malto-oligosyltrehalose trehalohydrolase
MPFGAELVAGGGVRFRLWAPDVGRVTLLLEEGGSADDRIKMPAAVDGWFEVLVPEAKAGSRYRFQVEDGLAVPDPASRFQPEDVHGPSEVIDPLAYRWVCTDWRGRSWEEVILYELHVGAFTPEGTFRAAISGLDYLVELGVTAIELMPVADFPGARDWGYDGAALFAPDAAYGRPEDLKALIDAAHARGLMVFLDVVYNHFGPEGNYLGVYAKRFFDETVHTPWGAAIAFAGKSSGVVRQFFVENALYWLNEFRFDGLRFDAVHAIKDPSSPDIIEQIGREVRARIPADRHVHLVLENDDNIARYLSRAHDGRLRLYEAQWNDDIHHALHVLLTGENRGYYADYATDPARYLARCLTEGFAWQGETSAFRQGLHRGEPSTHLPPSAFVSFLQNHDQIGNRAFGERIMSLAPPPAVHAGLALLLLSPSPPLLFMGEEWGSRRPFLFFCDLGDDLRAAVRDGRRREFASFPEFADPDARARIPDPTDPQTFARSKLDWAEAREAQHAKTLDLTRRLLAIRRREIVPRLAGVPGGAGRVVSTGRSALHVEWTLGDGAKLSAVANLSAASHPTNTPPPVGEPIFASEGSGTRQTDGMLPPWSVAFYLGNGVKEAR